jgi:hypothetical protein
MALLSQQKVRLSAKAKQPRRVPMLRQSHRGSHQQNTSSYGFRFRLSRGEVALAASCSAAAQSRSSPSNWRPSLVARKVINSVARFSSFGSSSAGQLALAAHAPDRMGGSSRLHVYCSSSRGAKYGAVLPNPSLNGSPNSVAYWPRSAGALPHFAPRVQRATLFGPP